MIFEEASQFDRARTLGVAGRIMRGLHIDTPLLAALALVAAMGLIVLYSAGGQSQDLLIRQIVRLGVALIAMLIAAQVPPKMLRSWAPWIFMVGLILLLLVLFFGVSGKGAQRWIDIGFRFQPSEIMKLAVPMAAAWYLHEKPLPPRFQELVALAVIILLPTVLIAKQPDLGTALLIASSGVFVVLLAGLRLRVILALGVMALSAAPVLWHFMRDYQKQRVLTLFDPESDPLGAGYHIIQSKIAIGSGGIFGKGWLNGSQAHLEFLPERSTDFIFAVLGEEFGLLGVLAILCAYLFIVARGLYIAVEAQDTFSRL